MRPVVVAVGVGSRAYSAFNNIQCGSPIAHLDSSQLPSRRKVVIEKVGKSQ